MAVLAPSTPTHRSSWRLNGHEEWLPCNQDHVQSSENLHHSCLGCRFMVSMIHKTGGIDAPSEFPILTLDRSWLIVKPTSICGKSMVFDPALQRPDPVLHRLFVPGIRQRLDYGFWRPVDGIMFNAECAQCPKVSKVGREASNPVARHRENL